MVFTVERVPQAKAIISIENVVATAAIKERLDLNLVVERFSEVKYEPKNFPGLVFKLKNPRTTTLIFSSGRFVCTGARSEEQAYRAVKLVARKLRQRGIEVHDEPEVTIQNIVATASLGGRVNIEDAARILKRSMYEPEQFPGLVHRMDDPHTVFLIFSSGKLVCTGAKREAEVYRAVSRLHNSLEEKGLIIY